MTSTPKNTARFAGLLYLLVALSAPFSMIYVPSVIVIAGDAAATASRLVESQSLFRLGLLNDALIALLEVALSAVLYVVLRPAGKTLALVATFARLGMAVLQGGNLFPSLAALELVQGSPSLAFVMLQVHERASHVWELFFGLHCFLVAALIWRAGYFPRVFAGLMAFAALGYSANAVTHLLTPSRAPALAGFVAIAALVGEVPFVFWLLIKGVDEPRWRQAQLGTSALPA